MVRLFLVLIVVVVCRTSALAQPLNFGNWKDEQEKRQAELASYLQEKEVAFHWFADFPFGTDDGTPYLILRSLPLLAPNEWGEGKDFLSVVGLFRDERQQDYPLARGVGWSGMGRKASIKNPDFASFSCGACHIGRVRKDDGNILYLDGGINSEFNLVAYRARVKRTLDRVLATANSPEDQLAVAKKAILDVIDEANKKDPNFFYGGYKFGQHFDANYEKEQIRLFKEKADSLIPKFLARMNLEVASLSELIKKNYPGLESQMMHGFGGMADATGVSSSFGFVVARDVMKDTEVTPESRLPPAPGLTDFMAVWEQGKRKVCWNSDKTKLIDGGGQWNGNIPLPVYRNLAAELTMGFGPATDVRIAEFGQQLLEDLPAPVYPFEVNLELAKKGKELFESNCADCHRPHNGRVYKNIGTDLSRARVVSPSIAAIARAGFTKIGHPERTIQLPPSGAQVKPFASYDGVSLADKPELSMRDPAECEGYNALPLGGIWAQAPYLHSGSVPTLYHLLVPNSRPNVFVKSRLEYDKELVGFQWKPRENETQSKGYEFDTRIFPTLSNRGHDRNIFDSGKVYKLDWSDNLDGAKALIEYMKTF